MSWFKRSPRVKEPPKRIANHTHSPMAEKKLEETKKNVRSKKKSAQNS